tara:strand:- start:6645 stop:7505 length:861 start_codon:yes stop_codon:yes gene_type:complete
MRNLLKPILLDELLKGINHSFLNNHSSIEIKFVGALNEDKNGMLTFSKENISSNNLNAIIFSPKGSLDLPSIIKVNNPRLSFSLALKYIENNIGFENIYSESISSDLSFGKNLILGKGVRIGKNVKIGNNVVINDFVEIGNNCVIKSGSIIGEDGFGFEKDKDSTPIRFPHIGNVLIEDNVEIGSFVTINRGTLGTTTIKKNVKIDDHVHVAHNVKICENSLICAGVVIGGSCLIGKRCWLGLNSTIHQKVIISDDATVGMGANVFKSIKEGITVTGFPSKNVPKI